MAMSEACRIKFMQCLVANNQEMAFEMMSRHNLTAEAAVKNLMEFAEELAYALAMLGYFDPEGDGDEHSRH